MNVKSRSEFGACQSFEALLAAALFFLPFSGLASNLPPIQTVFIILMENYSWDDIKGSTNAPFINNTLLPMASYCESFHALYNVFPSLPNYLWLESGTNFGIFDDKEPADDHVNWTNHLVNQLTAAGISWRTYQEHISGTEVPLITTNGYSARHNPFVYFDDITCTNDPACPYAIAHIRPYV